MNWEMRPRKVAGMQVTQVVDGFVVDQQDHDRVHFLNETAIILLELCNGKRRAAELPDLLASVFQLSTPPVEDVESCLTKLLEEGLLLDPEIAPLPIDQ